MNDLDRQLIESITQQVLTTLRERGQSSGEQAPTAQAQVNPPIGQCTGDYSKYPELAGRGVGAPPPATNVGTSNTETAPQPTTTPLTGIITANQLQREWDASPTSTALLAPDARLSPLAADLAREHPEKIQRAALAAATPHVDAFGATLPWLWWSDGHCPAVDALVTAQSSRLRASAASRDAAGLAQVVHELNSALRQRQVAGGLLFAPSAARAMCYTNRCAAIRAVVGTCMEAVEQGIRELGANVLVIEYPYVRPEQIAAMAARMTQHPPKKRPNVERELTDLHRL